MFQNFTKPTRKYISEKANIWPIQKQTYSQQRLLAPIDTEVKIVGGKFRGGGGFQVVK
jgi:hypothetical protein